MQCEGAITLHVISFFRCVLQRAAGVDLAERSRRCARCCTVQSPVWSGWCTVLVSGERMHPRDLSALEAETHPQNLRSVQGITTISGGSRISQKRVSNPKRECQPIIWAIFPKNAWKMKKLWFRVPTPPFLDSPMAMIWAHQSCSSWSIQKDIPCKKQYNRR